MTSDPSKPGPARSTDGEAADRLRLALEMADTAEAMLRQRLRRKHAGATAAAIEALVDAWYGKRPGAENGDADGVARPWPRGV